MACWHVCRTFTGFGEIQVKLYSHDGCESWGNISSPIIPINIISCQVVSPRAHFQKNSFIFFLIRLIPRSVAFLTLFSSHPKSLAA